MAGQGTISTSGSAPPADVQSTKRKFSFPTIEEDEKDAKEPSFSSPSQMVTFVIGKGEKKETFIVHKEHACRYSPVLEKAFNSEFQEGLTQKYQMEDTTSETFRIFVKWLYTQKLSSLHQREHPKGIRTLEELDPHELKCIEDTKSLLGLWVLAEKLLIPRLQNEIMDVLGRIRVTCLACVSAFCFKLQYIYDNTTDESVLRRFVVDVIAWAEEGMDYRIDPGLFPKAFLLDLATVFSAGVDPRIAARRLDGLDMADYHVEE